MYSSLDFSFFKIITTMSAVSQGGNMNRPKSQASSMVLAAATEKSGGHAIYRTTSWRDLGVGNSRHINRTDLVLLFNHFAYIFGTGRKVIDIRFQPGPAAVQPYGCAVYRYHKNIAVLKVTVLYTVGLINTAVYTVRRY